MAEKPQQQHDRTDQGRTDQGRTDQGRPAQVPGDAESPRQGTPSPAARKAPEHTDPTEPTHSQRDKAR